MSLVKMIIGKCVLFISCMFTSIHRAKAGFRTCKQWQYNPIPSTEPERWVNPCGVPIMYDDSSMPHVLTENVWLTIIKMIQQQQRKCKEVFDGFRIKYGSDSLFGRECCDHFKDWDNKTYDWLPNIPKTLEKPTDPVHFQDMQLTQFMIKSYKHFQVMDVALEQVLWDWAFERSDKEPDFVKDVDEVWRWNNAVMCQIFEAARIRGGKFMPDPHRDAMPKELRNLQSFEDRAKRDFMIFKHYSLLLEWLIDAISYCLKYKNKIWQGVVLIKE